MLRAAPASLYKTANEPIHYITAAGYDELRCPSVTIKLSPIAFLQTPDVSMYADIYWRQMKALGGGRKRLLYLPKT
jgi:hypothetical protein